jgi:hypothetical protein
MRTISTLVGLSLFALTTMARAEEAAPAAATPAPPAGDAVASPTPTPAATATTAVPEPAQPAPPRRKFQLGLAFQPMAKGKFPAGPLSQDPYVDAAFAYGVGLSAGYQILPGILPGLVVGLAPQVTLNVKAKEDTGAGGKQYDLMVRVAYAYQIVDTISVYAELLPGYSIVAVPNGDPSKGLVLAFGAGALMDLTDRTFANLGVGYEMGYQKNAATGRDVDARTKFVRVAIGGGVKF